MENPFKIYRYEVFKMRSAVYLRCPYGILCKE